MKKLLAIFMGALLICMSGLALAAEGGARLSPAHRKTLDSMKKLTAYQDGLNIYTMEVFYDYDIDKLTPKGDANDQQLIGAMLEQAVPGMKLDIKAPNFGCTAFSFKAADGKVYLGRNYDFRWDASAMMCYCHPKKGYKSVSFSALSNIGCNDPFASEQNKLASLAAPLIPLDGMNEKGLGIAVLTLSSKPTRQRTGKPLLSTPILVRLVLDRAATTKEAIELIKKYDYFATSGRDYHYYISDASGDGRVVEWDCEKADRPMVVTPLRTITNYFAMYADKVLPKQKNGIYGLGKERRDRVEAVITAAGRNTGRQTAWDGCIAASSKPDPTSVVSNTQWSAVYNLTDLSHEFVLHRHWEDKFSFKTLGRNSKKTQALSKAPAASPEAIQRLTDHSRE